MNFKIWLENYKGSHKSPNKNYGSPLHNIVGIYPEDVYDDIMQYASDFSQKEAAEIVMKYKDKPDNLIEIYRAVPKNIYKINPGDWVTITKKYAIQHSKHPTDPKQDLRVISGEAFAKDLYTDGNSLEEWGYDGDVPISTKPFDQ